VTLEKGTRLGAYEIVAPLGAGGMGEVYKARDTRLERLVAIKVLPARFASDPTLRARFDREARTISRLNDSRICAIYDVGHEGDTSYLVMELIEGDTLRGWLRDAARPLEALVGVALEVARALRAAHDGAIVHRDVKPDNVIVTRDGAVKVLDFGIAKLAESSDPTSILADHTAAGLIVGTARYMSPEQARGAAVDARSDIFSFGALLYEMLVGRSPFEAATTTDTIVAVLQREPPLLVERRADCAELQPLVSKCLQKEPDRRYASARELVIDLERLLVARQPTGPPLPSIAVLPFVNMSSDPDNEYFCDGITEDLIIALTKIERLRVAARTSAFALKGSSTDVKEVGRLLNVTTVLQGSVRKVGNRLRITAQVVNVADGFQLWSERYDRQLEDVFEIQDEISLAIVSALKVKLLGAEKASLVKRHTDNVEAFQLYLRGRHHWQKWSAEGFARAKEYMEQALAIDPDYALPYVGLADVHVASATVGLRLDPDPITRAQEHISRALAIDPELDMAWTLSCVVEFHLWNWRTAEHAAAQALRLNPRLAHAHAASACVEMFQGRFEQAIAAGTRAVELEPLSPQWNYLLAHALIGDRRPDAAWACARAMLDFDPTAWMAHQVRGMLLFAERQYPDAVAAFEQAVGYSGGSPTAIGALSCALATAGDRDAAERELRRLLRPGNNSQDAPALSIAVSYCGLGENERIFEWLEHACRQRDIWLRCAGSNPLLASVRHDPRMHDLMRRMNLGSTIC
jgi:eukaryotic-like serine/threonine-protein kinase